ncbi:TIGR04282 family arsenosugar biosynthesis glycosyltransferase [Mycolicibacterium elephantis]|uniref:TIGR04282 family arsenosugar biosynthesis glycosyltransferase n=1 Tax=Mycolicibacterium elephantis TaxID=81858 RepID=UPI000FE21D61|nr:DUF2064 domain-containing protein [Mycolicibacterium elephantis]MCV7220451.1 DUF2064 domain-containing protein [Mycolicibacterium elephantis]
MLPVVGLIVAKAPVPGLAKTRLAASIGARAAADIAAASLLDSLDAMIAAPLRNRVVALAGDIDAGCRADEIRECLTEFTVVPQRGADFAERLANAHHDAADATGHRTLLQIGMDTPQVSADMLDECARELLGAQAVLGLAKDGGWWVLGVSDTGMAECLRGVPMSRWDTGALTLAALYAGGIDVRLVAELADFDTVEDLEAVRRVCPAGSRFVEATRVRGRWPAAGPSPVGQDQVVEG